MKGFEVRLCPDVDVVKRIALDVWDNPKYYYMIEDEFDEDDFYSHLLVDVPKFGVYRLYDFLIKTEMLDDPLKGL